jgi:hypothetical protein
MGTFSPHDLETRGAHKYFNSYKVRRNLQHLQTLKDFKTHRTTPLKCHYAPSKLLRVLEISETCTSAPLHMRRVPTAS